MIPIFWPLIAVFCFFLSLLPLKSKIFDLRFYFQLRFIELDRVGKNRTVKESQTDHHIHTTSNLSNTELDVTLLNTTCFLFFSCLSGYRTADFYGFGKGGIFLFILHFLHWAFLFTILSLIMLVWTLSIEPSHIWMLFPWILCLLTAVSVDIRWPFFFFSSIYAVSRIRIVVSYFSGLNHRS